MRPHQCVCVVFYLKYIQHEPHVFSKTNMLFHVLNLRQLRMLAMFRPTNLRSANSLPDRDGWRVLSSNRRITRRIRFLFEHVLYTAFSSLYTCLFRPERKLSKRHYCKNYFDSVPLALVNKFPEYLESGFQDYVN